MDSFIKEQRRRTVAGVLSVLLTILTGALGLYMWISMRSLVLDLLLVFRVNPWSWRFIDNFSFLLFGIAWLGFVLYAQHYYNQGALRSRLLSRLCWMTGIQFLLLFLCRIVPVLLHTEVQSPWSWVTYTGLGLLGGLLIVYAKRSGWGKKNHSSSQGQRSQFEHEGGGSIWR
jgi:hypothetical protein